MKITLTVIEGHNRGLSFSFAEHATFLVGRSDEAHFSLPEDDRYFSRLHFLIEINPPLCRLVDLNSRNGTFVNGQRVQRTDLRAGDRIQAGHTHMLVHVTEVEAGVRAATLPVAPCPGGGEPAAAVAATGVYTPSLTPEGAAADAGGRLARFADDAGGNLPGKEKAAPAPPAVPGFRLERELGRGGMGIVYLARREADNESFALKMILPAMVSDEVSLSRFLREAEILRQLNHPHIVKFHEMGFADGRLFFVMEYAAGTDADQHVATAGALPVARAVGWICQLLAALEYAHAAGFVHRDIKPNNLLVVPGPDGEQVKLTDFGLARTYLGSPLSGLTVTGQGGGTPAFIPPEQVIDFRSAQPAADQYGAAATLYYLLTARLLYDATDNVIDRMLCVLQHDPVPIRERRPELPAALAQAIHRALSRRPADRFPDVQAFHQALLPFATG